MISVILPAGRSQEQAQRVVNRLCANEAKLDLIVTSPGFELIGVRNVRDDMAGSSRSIALAVTAAKGDFIAWLSDICLPARGALDDMLRFVDTPQDYPFIGEFRTVPPVTPGHYRVCTITGRQYARWGMMSRRSIELCGGFFDPAFVNHYGDVDLSLRCWKARGSVATCRGATVELDGHHHVSTAPLSADEALFIERWRGDYPTMRSDNTAEWNVDREIPL